MREKNRWARFQRIFAVAIVHAHFVFLGNISKSCNVSEGLFSISGICSQCSSTPRSSPMKRKAAAVFRSLSTAIPGCQDFRQRITIGYHRIVDGAAVDRNGGIGGDNSLVIDGVTHSKFGISWYSSRMIAFRYHSVHSSINSLSGATMYRKIAETGRGEYGLDFFRCRHGYSASGHVRSHEQWACWFALCPAAVSRQLVLCAQPANKLTAIMRTKSRASKRFVLS